MHGIVAAEQLTCGMHVHVEVSSAEEGVGVLDGIRSWLPVLLALSANSPFWNGHDTSYASFRSRVWNRWPTSGPTPIFGSVAAYDRLVGDLLATGVLLDKGMVYFDARLSRTFPTVEIRVPDVCLDLGAAELVAGLSRALVETAARQWRLGIPPAPVPSSLLRAGMWQAARGGLEGDLLDPRTSRPAPAYQAVAALVDHVRTALAGFGDSERIRYLIKRRLSHGSCAHRQRQAYAVRQRFSDVVAAAVVDTHGAPDDAREDEWTQPRLAARGLK